MSSRFISEALGLGGGPPSYDQAIGQSGPGSPDMNNADNITQEGLDLIKSLGEQERLKQQPPPLQEVSTKVDKNGIATHTVKMSDDALNHFSQLYQTGQATIQAFDQARQQIAAKQKFLQDHPIVAGLGSIFSTTAAGYAGGPGQAGRIAPAVRAAGAYGLSQFGKTPEELQLEQAGLEAQKFGVANQLYNQEQQDRTIRVAQANTETIQQKDQQRFLATFTGQLRADARGGLLNTGDEPALSTQLLQAGAATTQDQADSIARGLVSSSTTAQKIAEVKRLDKVNSEAAKYAQELQKFKLVQDAANSRFLAGQEAADRRQEERLAQADKRLGLAETKFRTPTSQQADLIGGNFQMRTFLDDLDKEISKHPKWVGIVTGKIPISYLGSVEQAKFRSFLQGEALNFQKVANAGTRFWNPSEFQGLQRFFVQADDRLPAAIGKIQGTRQYLNDKLQGDLVSIQTAGKDLTIDPRIKKWVPAALWDKYVTSTVPQATAETPDFDLEVGPDGKLREKQK